MSKWLWRYAPAALDLSFGWVLFDFFRTLSASEATWRSDHPRTGDQARFWCFLSSSALFASSSHLVISARSCARNLPCLSYNNIYHLKCALSGRTKNLLKLRYRQR
jgi:hypothetical protein